MRPEITVGKVATNVLGEDKACIVKLKRANAEYAGGRLNLSLRIGLGTMDVNKLGLTAFVAATGWCGDGRSAGPVSLTAF